MSLPSSTLFVTIAGRPANLYSRPSHLTMSGIPMKRITQVDVGRKYHRVILISGISGCISATSNLRFTSLIPWPLGTKYSSNPVIHEKSFHWNVTILEILDIPYPTANPLVRQSRDCLNANEACPIKFHFTNFALGLRFFCICWSAPRFRVFSAYFTRQDSL